jgi:hypothetical protein
MKNSRSKIFILAITCMVYQSNISGAAPRFIPPFDEGAPAIFQLNGIFKIRNYLKNPHTARPAGQRYLQDKKDQGWNPQQILWDLSLWELQVRNNVPNSCNTMAQKVLQKMDDDTVLKLDQKRRSETSFSREEHERLKREASKLRKIGRGDANSIYPDYRALEHASIQKAIKDRAREIRREMNRALNEKNKVEADICASLVLD